MADKDRKVYAYSPSIRIGNAPTNGAQMTSIAIGDHYGIDNISTQYKSVYIDPVTDIRVAMESAMIHALYNSFSTISAVIRVITSESLTAMRIAISRLPAQLFQQPENPQSLFKSLFWGTDERVDEHMCAQLQRLLYCDTQGLELDSETVEEPARNGEFTTTSIRHNVRNDTYVASAIPTSKAIITQTELEYQKTFVLHVKQIYIKYYVRDSIGIILYVTFVTSIYSSCKEVKRPANTQFDPVMKAQGITSFAAGRHLFMINRTPFNEHELAFYNDLQLTLVFPSVTDVPLFMLDGFAAAITNGDIAIEVSSTAYVHVRGSLASVLGTITINPLSLPSFIGPHRNAYLINTADTNSIHQIITQLYRPESQTISYAKVIVSQTAEIELPHIIIYDRSIQYMIEQIMRENHITLIDGIPKVPLPPHTCYIIGSIVNAVRNKAAVLTLQNGNPSANTIKALEDAILTAKTAAFHHFSSNKR